MFYVLKGRNGAIYIINANNWNAITNSLKFYKAHSVKTKILKQTLTITLFLIGKLFTFKLKTKVSIADFINNTLRINADFSLDKNCSVLISPTRDKVIVNHHGQYFHKFAFGKSFTKVKNESTIYNLLKHAKEFQVASLEGLHLNEQESFCSFKLVNPPVNQGDRIKAIDNLPLILVEFFNSGTLKKRVDLSYYIGNLFKRYHLLDMESANNLISYFKKIQEEYNKETMPLGLVHRDFKPWNTLLNNELLIFDFEETVIDGPPLEDLLNYYVDPVIRYKSSSQVHDLIFSKERIVEYKAILNLLNVNVPFDLFIVAYTVERIIFWTLSEDPYYARCYQNLLEYILKSSK